MRLLNDKNVYVNADQLMANKVFEEQYNAATSVFNNFYGALAMAANNAFTEAMDSFEGSSVYRFQVKKMFQRISKEWDKFWVDVRAIFEHKYSLYIDYISQSIADIQPDINKLYLAVDNSLMMQQIEDHDRRAWLFVADLITHELVRSRKEFVKDLVNHTHNQVLGETFDWADVEHIRRHTHELLRTICNTDIYMTDDVHLAMKVIGRRVTDAERQDEAALRTFNYDEHEAWREDAADRIEAYLQHKEELAEEKEKAKQAEIKRREEWSRRRRQGKREFLTSDAVADKLSEKFKVKRV